MQLSDDELNTIMQDADVDGDGQIDFKEFMGMMRGINGGKGPEGKAPLVTGGAVKEVRPACDGECCRTVVGAAGAPVLKAKASPLRF